MASFLGLVVLLAFASFDGVSARVIGYHNEKMIKQGEIFKGKDSLTLTEYTQSLEKVVGRKSNPNDIDKAKKVKLVSQELLHFGENLWGLTKAELLLLKLIHLLAREVLLVKKVGNQRN